jgi:hypothetical protein
VETISSRIGPRPYPELEKLSKDQHSSLFRHRVDDEEISFLGLTPGGPDYRGIQGGGRVVAYKRKIYIFLTKLLFFVTYEWTQRV